jgi:lysophospholipase L1-like esterase
MGLRRNVIFCGDSITDGTGGATGMGGFRGILLGLRRTNGLPWRAGGGTTTGTFGANRYVGASGQTIAQIATNLNIDGSQWKYDTVIAHVGTNDATQRNTGGTPTLATSQADLTTFLDKIRSQQPEARVFFALIIPNQDAGANTLITAQNAAFTTQIAARSDASYITIVDMNAEFLANATWATDWMSDVTHPNQQGYLKMANVWDSALTTAGW